MFDILYIDHDASHRDKTVAMISSLGYELQSVDDCPKGQEILNHELPALIIIDASVPNGYDFGSYVHKHPRTASIPIAYIADHGGSEGLQQCIAHKGAFCLSRPLTAHSLRLALGSLLRRKESAPAP